ncbi:VanZ family protein [Serpentinicella alkaliphila]|uniref:VanZ like protein n=2 Tax=Serpentinicella alkaliphila TaxID=1734049 RepID=A0A4R2T3Q1_9FIRM|nr:VanZ family protein [Serpentinicella alkaliphila]TCP97607.1 VanZ like protein [Serpentinicella alkaliphila]
MNKRRIITMVLLVYTLILAYWMLFAFGRGTNPNYMYNLRPFLTIRRFLRFSNFSFHVWVINLIGNVAVFIPFGIFIPISFSSKFIKTQIIFLSGLFILEVLQLVTRRGSFDIDDFILNTLGVTIGYLTYKILLKLNVVN